MKTRMPGTLSAAINEIKTKLSERKCAEILERSDALIRKWADPDDPALPNLRQSIILDAAYMQAGFGEPPIQKWYIDKLSGIVRADPQETVNIVFSTLYVQSTIGGIASLVVEFTEKGNRVQRDLSSNERAVLLGMVEKLSRDLERLEKSLEDKITFEEPISLSRLQVK